MLGENFSSTVSQQVEPAAAMRSIEAGWSPSIKVASLLAAPPEIHQQLNAILVILTCFVSKLQRIYMVF